jgi:hypothetical protein
MDPIHTINSQRFLSLLLALSLSVVFEENVVIKTLLKILLNYFIAA